MVIVSARCPEVFARRGVTDVEQSVKCEETVVMSVMTDVVGMFVS